MQLIPLQIIELNQDKMNEIEKIVKATYRLIIFSREHLDDDVLDTFIGSIHSLKELVGIRNAEMEGETEDEIAIYLKNLEHTLSFIIEQIKSNIPFETELQLFQLFRLVSPEAHQIHPNRYRQNLVQVGGHVCPEPLLVPQLAAELFYNLRQISNPILKAIYLHHELVRIHPFVDGNGRVTRIAKNWILMFDLYPPVFIKDAEEKKKYIETLSMSFKTLAKSPFEWNEYTAMFFEQELDRLLHNALLLYNVVNQMGQKRRV